MDVHAIVLFLCVCSHLVGHNGIEGDWRSLTKEEDLELEERLKHLNKPAVKTIQNNYGDIYDCVDFYKQPAFDHPLLKNHTFHFQMKPTSLPKRSNVRKPLHIGLNGGGCPVGTVPIRRTTKEDLIREKLASKIMTPADDTSGADVSSEVPASPFKLPGTDPDIKKDVVTLMALIN
ncbi:hypothetical protein HYC85_004299 [Camellia sinensis]|uniref:Neprosin activation peptide domain-containing protein n=1 Tax=Camellia sinensis TaxID=4442 RepID=A0A7J7HY95_CAMSI|nr:hypothetical protein HYC85_004299 [Camellia sinensis]